MEKIIEIDINKENDLVDKYNEKKLSNELLKYIIKQSIYTQKNTQLKIVINKKCTINKNCIELVKQGLKEEYNQSIEARNRNNMKQLVFFLIGISFIFLANLIPNRGFWKEILIITGWVPIWEMVEIELFPDIYGRRERRTIRKLLNSEIIERNDNNE